MGFRIYFGESILDIGETPTAIHNKSIPLVRNEVATPESIVDSIATLLREEMPQHIILRSQTPEEDFHLFRNQFRIIAAAGGLVRNENGGLLFIYRRGKWDLPKGKIDDGESIQTCARREVEEECGIRVSFVDELFSITYHVYREHDGQLALKETFWFTMRASESESLQPQLEEDITAIEWADVNRQQTLLNNTYPLIRELLEHYHKKYSSA